MKMRLVLALALCGGFLASPAFAKEKSYSNCTFKIGTDPEKSGACKVSPGDEIVTITMGKASYGVMLEEGNEGTFVFVPSMRQIDEVKKQGDCWSGTNVRFCAR